MKKAIPFVLVIVLLVSVGLTFAQGGLPGSGWKSGQQAQNVGSASAKVVMTAYEQNGTSHDCGEKTIASGASATYLTDTDCPVDAGFIGSAVLSADQAIAAIVNVNNRGTGAAAGQYQGTDGVDVADTISFPLVKNNHSGRTTTFYVQNASTSPNNMTATFSVNGTDYSKTYNNVPGNAMVIISPSTLLYFFRSLRMFHIFRYVSCTASSASCLFDNSLYASLNILFFNGIRLFLNSSEVILYV